MNSIKTIEGNYTHASGNYAIVAARWNSFIVHHLIEGAIDTLKRHGIDESSITLVIVRVAMKFPLSLKH